MVRKEINNAITVPEDEGTGLPQNSADWISAGHIAGLIAQRNNANYVEQGLDLSVDDTTLTIGSGLVFIHTDRSVDVQNASGQYNRSWDHGVVYGIHVGENTVQLERETVNHVFIELDLGTNNGCFYTVEVGSNPSVPSAPHLRIGTVDLYQGDVTIEERNRFPYHRVEQILVDEAPSSPNEVARLADIEDLDFEMGVHDNDLHSEPYATEATVASLSDELAAIGDDLADHANATDNPHSVSLGQLGAAAEADLDALESALDDKVDTSGDTMTGPLTWTPSNRPVLQKTDEGGEEGNALFEFEDTDDGRQGYFGWRTSGGKYSGSDSHRLHFTNQNDGTEFDIAAGNAWVDDNAVWDEGNFDPSDYALATEIADFIEGITINDGATDMGTVSSINFRNNLDVESDGSGGVIIDGASADSGGSSMETHGNEYHDPDFATASALSDHAEATDNPHSVTASQVGAAAEADLSSLETAVNNLTATDVDAVSSSGGEFSGNVNFTEGLGTTNSDAVIDWGNYLTISGISTYGSWQDDGPVIGADSRSLNIVFDGEDRRLNIYSNPNDPQEPGGSKLGRIDDGGSRWNVPLYDQGDRVATEPYVDDVSSAVTSHETNTENPHEVTASQVGAANSADLSDLETTVSNLSASDLGAAAEADLSDLEAAVNNLSASDVGAASSSDLSSHTGATDNPHGVTASQVGSPTTTDFTDHTSASNPHGLSAEDVGAATEGYVQTQIGDFATEEYVNTEVSDHSSNTSNPHNVTAAQTDALSTSGGSMSGDIDMELNTISADTSNTNVFDVTVDENAYSQFALFNLAGHGDVAWGPNNESSRGNAMTIFDYGVNQYLFSVQLSGDGVDVHQGDLRVSNGDVEANNVSVDGVIEFTPQESDPSNPSNGTMWFRQ